MKAILPLMMWIVCFPWVLRAGEPTGRYKMIVDQMLVLQKKYSAVSNLIYLGPNGEGTEIIGMRVSITPTVMDPKKVAHIIVSTHHGDESAAPVFTMVMLEKLIQRYLSDELYLTDLAKTEWVVIPVLNITGYNANQRREYARDPNRDYPSPCTNHPGGALKSISQLIRHLTGRIYSGSLTVHGYQGSFTYPWGLYSNNYQTLDHNQFAQITAKAVSINGYKHGTASDIVYPANGCYEDYAYWKHGLWSLLLELKSGSAEDIRLTTLATFNFFDQLDSSPSVKNQFNGKCTRESAVDLRME